MQYRKKPVVVEAVCFDEHFADEKPEWLAEALFVSGNIKLNVSRNGLPQDSRLSVKAPKGMMHAKWGDWIVRGKSGALDVLSPEEFSATYDPAGAEPTENLDIGAAIAAAENGKKFARAGWNGADMFVYLVPKNSYPAQTSAAKSHFGEGAMVPYRAYLALKTAQGDVATWAPSCSDALAKDYYIVE